MTICEVETLVEIGVEQDNPASNLEGKTVGIAVGRCQDQNQSPGLDQVLE